MGCKLCVEDSHHRRSWMRRVTLLSVPLHDFDTLVQFKSNTLIKSSADWTRIQQKSMQYTKAKSGLRSSVLCSRHGNAIQYLATFLSSVAERSR